MKSKSSSHQISILVVYPLWGRETVKLGIKEIESGFACLVENHKRGDRKTEEKLSNLILNPIRNSNRHFSIPE